MRMSGLVNQVEAGVKIRRDRYSNLSTFSSLSSSLVSIRASPFISQSFVRHLFGGQHFSRLTPAPSMAWPFLGPHLRRSQRRLTLSIPGYSVIHVIMFNPCLSSCLLDTHSLTFVIQNSIRPCSQNLNSPITVHCVVIDKSW